MSLQKDADAGLPRPGRGLRPAGLRSRCCEHVYDRCCKGGIAARQPRAPVTSTSQLVAGYRRRSTTSSPGKLFQQPANSGRPDQAPAGRDRPLRPDGRRASSDQYVRRAGAAVSNSGASSTKAPAVMRLMRPGRRRAGQRVAAGQLLALQPPGSAGLRLAAVRWLTLTVERRTAYRPAHDARAPRNRYRCARRGLQQRGRVRAADPDSCCPRWKPCAVRRA
ncbi:MAG: hypothetical protein MZW92_77115 [Comamonadaceae bacterium]|nr:hypothetical protein [Comamonadaceae bacterium]